MHVVFVYGTLRRGEPNHHLLAGARCLGDGETAGRFVLLDLGAYPAVAAGSPLTQSSRPGKGHEERGGTVVRGEAYEVDEATFLRLDDLEGYPQLYNRRRIRVNLDDGRRDARRARSARLHKRQRLRSALR